MIEFKAFFSIMLMVFLYMFGSRKIANVKDFVYFDLSYTFKKILYVRDVPKGKITFASFAMQCLIIVTIIMQVLSIIGTNILKPVLNLVWFGKYMFPLYDNPSFQTMFCIVGIFLPGAFIIILYFFVCTIFSSVRYD